jgi:hypothetical protein
MTPLKMGAGPLAEDAFQTGLHQRKVLAEGASYVVEELFDHGGGGPR